MSLTMDYFKDWLERYFTAWKTNQRELLDGLFADKAVYYFGPFREPSVGKQTIVKGWLASPPPDEMRYSCSPIAISEDTGVAHWNVVHHSTSKPDHFIEIDGILVIKFDAHWQCIEHKEWFLTREIPLKT